MWLDRLCDIRAPPPTIELPITAVPGGNVYITIFVASSKWPHTVLNLTLLHDLLEHLELERRLEGDEVHAPLTAEVATVEPVPVLEAVPRLTPRKEIVVGAQFAVGDSWGKKGGLSVDNRMTKLILFYFLLRLRFYLFDYVLQKYDNRYFRKILSEYIVYSFKLLEIL